MGDDIFQGLGENFFKDAQAPGTPKQGKKDPLEIGAKTLDTVMKVSLVALVIFGIDSSIRSLETPGFLEALPVCDYLSFGIDGYANEQCKTPTQIVADKSEEEKQVTSTLANNLLVLVPKRLEAGDALNSPEVQFIKERSGDSRVAFKKVIDDFQEKIVAKSDYYGEDISCSRFKFNEKGEFSVDCETYGGSLNDSAFKESRSSRITAIGMLSRLEASDFRIINPPKALDIAKYSAADVGIRSTFSTVTRLQLNLRYVPSATGNRP